jgi:hypothetical protein
MELTREITSFILEIHVDADLGGHPVQHSICRLILFHTPVKPDIARLRRLHGDVTQTRIPTLSCVSIESNSWFAGMAGGPSGAADVRHEIHLICDFENARMPTKPSAQNVAL